MFSSSTKNGCWNPQEVRTQRELKVMFRQNANSITMYVTVVVQRFMGCSVQWKRTLFDLHVYIYWMAIHSPGGDRVIYQVNIFDKNRSFFRLFLNSGLAIGVYTPGLGASKYLPVRTRLFVACKSKIIVVFTTKKLMFEPPIKYVRTQRELWSLFRTKVMLVTYCCWYKPLILKSGWFTWWKRALVAQSRKTPIEMWGRSPHDHGLIGGLKLQRGVGGPQALPCKCKIRWRRLIEKPFNEFNLGNPQNNVTQLTVTRDEVPFPHPMLLVWYTAEG